MKRKRKSAEKWNLYESRLRGVILIDIVSQGFCSRTNSEIGKIIKAPAAYVSNLLEAGEQASEWEIHKCELEGRKIVYKSVQRFV